VLEDDAPIEGVWSAGGLRRVLENLVHNAVKYGEPRRPITVTLRHQEGVSASPSTTRAR
jgi:signal transduction histidine kinase